jgi:hypothetical protein
LLHAVSQLDEPTLQRELGRLVDAERLHQRGLPPQATYLFKHALIRDIADESLFRSTWQGYHQRVATVKVCRQACRLSACLPGPSFLCLTARN